MLQKSRKLTVSGEPPSEARKPKSKAIALGQVFTEASLARKMASGLGLAEASMNSLVLDPCVGPGTFPMAINAIRSQPINIDAIDIDQTMCRQCKSASRQDSLRVVCGDYLLAPVNGGYDYAILNPPYVRQEWIRNKSTYREGLKRELGVSIPGTANLYVYFIAKTLFDLKEGGKLSCIVYDSWQSTIYGRWLKELLDSKCRMWWTESAPATPFDGRLIDATIIYAEVGKPKSPRISVVKNTTREGFASIDDLFVTCRGLRLKQANFFLSDFEDQVREGSTPFVKKVAKIPGYIVPPEHPEAALIIEKGTKNRQALAVLEQRLRAASTEPESNISILNWARERPDDWVFHRPPPRHSLLFNYYLRHRPRHVYNPGRRAFSDNFYGATPRDNIGDLAWLAAINSTVSVTGLMNKARNQGSGLAKLQLFEYRSANVLDLRPWGKMDLARMKGLGTELAEASYPNASIVRRIDELVFSVLSEPRFDPEYVAAEYQRSDQAAKQPSVSRK